MTPNELAAILNVATGHNLRRLRIGDLDVEWTEAGSMKRAEVVTAPADGDAEPAAQMPPDLVEQTDEQMALYSSAAYTTTTAPKKQPAKE